MTAIKLPQFPGFELSAQQRNYYLTNGRLYRLGIKVNTPNVCNWSCPYCYVGNKNVADRPRLKDSDENAGFKLNKDSSWLHRMSNWIDQGIALGVKAVTLNGTFEPTTSPDLIHIIDFCRKRDLRVTLVTNGSTLKKQDMLELYKLGVNILTKMNVPFVDHTDSRYNLFCDIQKHLTGRTDNAQKIYEQQKQLYTS